MHDALILLAAVVGGWLVQTLLTYRQSTTFNRQVVELRRLGKVSVGVAGNRYRGGRAFVAIAVDDRSRVAGALVLRGWTTFAGAQPLGALVGARVGQLAGDTTYPGLSAQERQAARDAATSVRSTLPTAG